MSTQAPCRGALIPLLCFVALCGVLLLVHRPAFEGPFYFDTVGHLVDKSNLHLVDLSWSSLYDAVRLDHEEPGLYRLVSYLSLAFKH